MIEERRSLRRRLRQVHAVHPIVFAVDVHAVHARGIGVDAAPTVFHDRPVLPARLPEAVADIEVLLGDCVPFVVLRQRVAAEVAGAALEVRSDDVPRDAAPGQVVERRHRAREGERVVLQNGARPRESQVLGRSRHRGDEDRRIVDRDLRSVGHGSFPIAMKDVVNPDDIGQEERVEEPLLEEPRQLEPRIEIGVRVHLVAGLGPEAGRLMHDAVHVERVEENALGHDGAPLTGPPTARRPSGPRASWRPSPGQAGPRSSRTSAVRPRNGEMP